MCFWGGSDVSLCFSQMLQEPCDFLRYSFNMTRMIIILDSQLGDFKQASGKKDLVDGL